MGTSGSGKPPKLLLSQFCVAQNHCPGLVIKLTSVEHCQHARQIGTDAHLLSDHILKVTTHRKPHEDLQLVDRLVLGCGDSKNLPEASGLRALTVITAWSCLPHLWVVSQKLFSIFLIKVSPQMHWHNFFLVNSFFFFFPIYQSPKANFGVPSSDLFFTP